MGQLTRVGAKETAKQRKAQSKCNQRLTNRGWRVHTRKRPTVRSGWQAVNRELRLGRTTVANARYREEATMADHLDSVKSLAPLYHAAGKRHEDAGRHVDAQVSFDRAIAIGAVVEELEELRRISQPVPASYGDLSDLPPSLLKELSGLRTDDREQQLFTIIKS